MYINVLIFMCYTVWVKCIVVVVSGNAAANECDFKAPAAKQIKKSDNISKCDQSIEVTYF